MAIAFGSSAGSGSASAVGTFAFTLPTGIVAGDILLANVNCRGSVTTTLTIAGWDPVRNTANGTASGDARVATFIRVAKGETGGSDADSLNRTVTLSPTSVLDVAVARYTGVDGTTPQDAVAVGQANASTVNEVAPSITTVTAGAMLIMAGGNTGGVTTAPGTSGMTERIESIVVRDAVFYDEPRPTAGATGTRTLTLSGGRLNVGQLIALRPAASGASTLVAQDGAHGHTTDAVALAQVHQLAAADASHAHALDAPVLTQTHVLTASDGTHGHAADSPALTQQSTLAPADAVHGHTADSPTLTAAATLAVADGTHAHTSDPVTLGQVHNLTAQDGAHVHSADAVTLTQIHVLVAQDAAHAHSTDPVALTQTHQLVAQDGTSGHTSDPVTLNSGGTLAAQDATHGHQCDSPALTQTHVLVLQDGSHVHLTDVVALGQTHQLALADGTHAHFADTVTLVPVGPAAPVVTYHTVFARPRVLTVSAASRPLDVEADARPLDVVADERPLDVAARPRTLTVEAVYP